MIVGVTGRYCAGKTTVARVLETVVFNKQKVKNISVDKIGHQALEKHASTIIGAFGQEIARADGTIQRRALARIVFQDSTKLATLERIVHPWMTQHVQSMVHDTSSHVIIDAALLHYMGLHALCDVIVIVHSPLLIRMIRGKKRDKLRVSSFLRRNAVQKKIPHYWQYVFHKIYRGKKLLNLRRKTSELLVSGISKYSRLEKQLHRIIEGVGNETKFW